jgi:hypothetical protein
MNILYRSPCGSAGHITSGAGVLVSNVFTRLVYGVRRSSSISKAVCLGRLLPQRYLLNFEQTYSLFVVLFDLRKVTRAARLEFKIIAIATF